jgi:hypothetical protein
MKIERAFAAGKFHVTVDQFAVFVRPNMPLSMPLFRDAAGAPGAASDLHRTVRIPWSA